MNKKEIIFTLNELPNIAKELAEELQNCKIITFEGPLGAGKTTLIRELLRIYGVNENIVSPTFNYLNIYKNKSGKTFYHFDLYRVQKVDDFLAAGFDEYLMDTNGICLIEWPEVIEPILKLKHQHVCKITIDYHKDENTRVIKLDKNY